MLHNKSILIVCCGAFFSVSVLLNGAALSKADVNFMSVAAKANMTEAHLGQMAETHASRQGVKDFGQKLSKDHIAAYEGLTVLANKTGQKIPKAIGRDHTIERLLRLKGKAFDRAFLQDEVQSHKTAVAVFHYEATQGTNPDVKAWAKSMVPTLEGHLKTAENLAKAENGR